jgi:hypothetical protein
LFEKEKQKLLRVRAEPIRRGRSQNIQRFFASFFSKKKSFTSPAHEAQVVKLLPGFLFLTAGLCVGVFLGLNYLRGTRRLGWIPVHLLLGAAGLEQLAMMLQDGRKTALMTWSAGLVALALCCGLLTPIVAGFSRRRAELLLVTHISAGLSGYLAFLAWLARR